MPERNFTAQDYFYMLLGFISGLITGVAVGALADGTEGAVVPFLGTDTVRYQNYALLGLACAGLGANMSLRFSSAKVSKLTIAIALAAAYAGVSFTDSASNAVSDPSNSLQIPSNIAAPVVTVGVAAFFVLVASALSSSSMPTASRQAQTAERYAYALLGLVSGAITGLAVGALADGTEGAVVPFLGTDTVRYQNYALLGLACAGLGANMSLRLSSAQVSKLTVVMALIAAYAAVSFTDSASNAVSDPSNSLQIPSNIAAPVVTIGVAAFFVLVASALSSSPMQTASSQPQAIVRDGARYEAVGSPAHPRAVARIADAEANAEPAASARALPMADPFAELVGASAAQEPIHHPSFNQPIPRTGFAWMTPRSTAAGAPTANQSAINALTDSAPTTPPRAADAVVIGTGATPGAHSPAGPRQRRTPARPQQSAVGTAIAMAR